MLTKDLQLELGGYVFTLPKGFAEPEVTSADAFSVAKTAATADITFDILVAPRGGDVAIDHYFGAALRQYDDGQARGFDLRHMGQAFRGWLIEGSPKLSSSPGSFIQYYGTVAGEDAVCFSWASVGAPPEEANFEFLFLTIIYGGIVRHGPWA